MAYLQIYNQDIATSIVGGMLFPNHTAKAHAAASSILASGPLRSYCAEYGSLSAEQWLSVTESLVRGNFSDEIEHRYYVGGVVGQIVKTLWSLICRDPASASWKKAMRIVEDHIAIHGGKTGFSTFHRQLQEMKSCLHLWGAVAIRKDIFGRMWLADPSIGYDGFMDANCFLAESEILLRELLTWNEKFKMHSQHLEADHIRAWDGWQAPELRSHWPKTGIIPRLMPSVYIPPARKRGRRKMGNGVPRH